MTPTLRISDSVQIASGTLVKLKRFSNVLWVVKFGWYEYNNRQYQGWYFLSIPAQNVLPVNELDFEEISVVSGKLVDTKPEIPQIPQSDTSVVPCPGPVNPQYIPAFVSKADKELYDSAFITVPDVIALHSINPRTLHDGKIVRVNDVEGEVKYFIWSASANTWDNFNLSPGVSTRSDEKIISVDNDVIWSTLSISVVVEDSIPYVVLRGIDGIEVSRFDASIFTNSGSLKSVRIEDRVIEGVNHKILVMEFEMADGTITTVECDFTDAMQIYSAEVDGGLKLANFAFSIDNVVEPSSGLNSDITLKYGEAVPVNTIKYDKHGLIAGYRQISITMPSIIGEIGSRDYSKLLTYAAFDNTGQFVGDVVDIVTEISDESTDRQIPTAKAVYSSVSESTSTWSSV